MSPQYFIKRGDKLFGPFSPHQVEAGIKQKQLKSKDLVSTHRTEGFVKLGSVYLAVVRGEWEAEVSETADVSPNGDQAIHEDAIANDSWTDNFDSSYQEESGVELESSSYSDDYGEDDRFEYDLDEFEDEPPSHAHFLPEEESGIRVFPKVIPGEVQEFLRTKERVHYAKRASKLVLWAMLLTVGIPFLIMLLIFSVVAMTGGPGASQAGMFFGLTLVGFAVVALFVRMKWANTVYIITGYRLIIRTGVFNRAIRIVPVSAVNEITINTGTVDRFLGLNKVRFTTAASGAGLPLLSIWFPNDGAVVFSHVNSKEVMKAFTRATT